MPIYDTPINTDDNGIKQVLGTNLPVMLVLSSGTLPAPVADAAKKLAKKQSGDMLIATVDISDNPTTAAKYKDLDAPAVVTLENKAFGRRVKSQAGAVRPVDLRNHAAFLLGDGPDPTEIAAKQATKKNGTPEPTGKPVDVDQRSFRNVVLKGNKPVFVDFWAPWCGPCHTIAPVVEQLAAEYKGRVEFVKVNVDENQGISRKYGIQSIPTLMVFKNGQIVQSTYGAQGKRVLKNMIEEALL